MDRLTLISTLIPPCRRLVDIGSDHATVPLTLLAQNICQRVLITDIRKGPIDVARRRVEVAGFTSSCDFVLSDGLDHVTLSEGDVLLISGLGGENIGRIIERGFNKLQQTSLMILQPQTKDEALRKTISDLRLTILDEQIAVEDRRPYLAIICDSAANISKKPLTPLQIEFGPIILNRTKQLVMTKEMVQNENERHAEHRDGCEQFSSFGLLQSLALDESTDEQDRNRLFYLLTKIDKISRRSSYHPEDQLLLGELLQWFIR